MTNQELFETDPLRVEEKKPKPYLEETDEPHPEHAPSDANRYAERKKEDS